MHEPMFPFTYKPRKKRHAHQRQTRDKQRYKRHRHLKAQTIQLIDIILLSLMHNCTGTEESTDLHNGMNSHMTETGDQA